MAGRNCKRWAQGIPDWEQVPGGVNVKEIARLWTYARTFDMIEYGKMRYNMMGNGGHWMPGQKAERFDEAPLREALRESPFVDQLPQILREANRMLGGKAVQRLSKSEA